MIFLTTRLLFNRLRAIWPKVYQRGSLEKSHKNGNYSVKQAMRKSCRPTGFEPAAFGFTRLVSSIFDLQVVLFKCTFHSTIIYLLAVSTTSANLTGNSGIEVLCRVVQRYVNDRLQLSLLLLILTMFIDELQNTVSCEPLC